MRQNQFETLDLNLLRIFDALFVERSGTRAGERLGLSQSAISHSLARLRFFLKDELFIRSAGGMMPTPMAMEIGPAVHQLLSQLRTALIAPKFEAPESDRVFSIAAGDYASAALLPKMLARLRTDAPNIHVRVLPLHPTNIADLEDGQIDLVIAHFGPVDDHFETEKLLEDTIVCVMDRDNPRAKKALTLKQIVRLPLIIPGYGAGDHRRTDRMILWRGVDLQPGWRRVLFAELEREEGSSGTPQPRRVFLVSLLAAIDMLKGTDYAAIMPARMVRHKAKALRLSIRELPYPKPLTTTLEMLSHRTHGAQPAVLWLRNVIREIAAGLDE
jgi:DNA-binding transcriptional LysR family regulator